MELIFEGFLKVFFVISIGTAVIWSYFWWVGRKEKKKGIK
jgi:hypothetical protein